jgi:2-amino-4-hydroxy-6-hydroxymethyldihydropteridine diphosphokinase
LRTPETAYIALGANLGDRLGTMRDALDRVARIEGVTVTAVSSAYDTAPVGPPDQPRYLNAAAALSTRIAPRELLRALLRIERDLGRDRTGSRWTARTIDLDLILFGECIEGGSHPERPAEGGVPCPSVDSSGILPEPPLELPHPRFRERAFVLVPLAEIAPHARDPVTGEQVESLLRACPGRADAIKVGPL